MRINTDRLALELKRARRPFGILLVLVAFAVVAAWYVFHKQEAQWPWQATRKYQVAFQDVKGVRPGQQQVRIAGVKVGLISKAKVSGKTAVLTLSLDDKYGKLYKNARMRLRPVTPLQDMYVSIDSRGTPSAGELGKSEILGMQRTDSPVDISRVLNTFDTDTRSRLAQLTDDFGKGVGGHGEELRQAFASLAPFLRTADRLAGAMTDRRREIARVVDNLGRLTAAVNTRDKQLTALVRDGHTTVAELAAHDQTLAATLSELPRTMSQMRSSFATLRDAETEVDPALASLRPVAAKLESGLKSLEGLSDDATPSLKALSPAAKDLRPLATSLSPTSTALKDAFTKLAPTAPRLDRVTQDLVPCRLSTTKFFQWTLSVFKFYDDNGAWPRGELVLGAPAFSLGTVKDPVLRRGWSCTQGGKPK
ncbi:MlaD family protein [Patulibacter minatonensis]|uniref:MlaD family protein n=1 Tax=Patulibacter minatonensis TaxID=298163 RepID=UPI00047A3422|nr:MlaD family protein [Patulibacter minatonensis]